MCQCSEEGLVSRNDFKESVNIELKKLTNSTILQEFEEPLLKLLVMLMLVNMKSKSWRLKEELQVSLNKYLCYNLNYKKYQFFIVIKFISALSTF